MDVLLEALDCAGFQEGGADGGAAVAEPNDVFATLQGAILDRDLLECLNGLGEPLGVKGAVHVLEGEGCGQVVEGVEKVFAAAGVALEQLQGVVADNHEFSRSGELAGLGEEVSVGLVAEVG